MTNTLIALLLREHLQLRTTDHAGSIICCVALPSFARKAGASHVCCSVELLNFGHGQRHRRDTNRDLAAGQHQRWQERLDEPVDAVRSITGP